MIRRNRIQKTREIQLTAIAGLISAFIFISQFNLGEILRVDRLQHFIVSGALFFFFYMIFQGLKGRMLWAFAVAFSVGVLKEFFDHQAQNFDLAANSMGLFVALVCLFGFQFLIQNKKSPIR